MKKAAKIIIGTGIFALMFGTTAQAQTGSAYLPYYNYPDYGYVQPYQYNYGNYNYYQPYYPIPTGVSLSQSSLYLNVGQSATVTAYGTQPYSVSSTNPGIVWQNLIDNTLTIQAIAPGSATLTVCSGSMPYYYSSYYNNCATLFVTVTGNYGGGGYYPYPHDYELLSAENIEIEVGEREEIQLYTVHIYHQYRNDDFYISSNTNRNAVSAKIDDDELIVTGRRRGTATITVCNDYTCDTVRVRVED